MDASILLKNMLAYQAWANDELMQRLCGMARRTGNGEGRAALRLMNHIHVVSRIFAAHLTGVTHGYENDNPEQTPEPAALRAAISKSDRWYLDYIETLRGPELARPIAFTFTDGDKGCMTAQEMLVHVVLHGSYHRGEVGRMLARLRVSPPWDTYAVHLHRADPARRLQWHGELTESRG